MIKADSILLSVALQNISCFENLFTFFKNIVYLGATFCWKFIFSR